METFYDVQARYDWETVRKQIYACTPADVERALEKERITMDDFAALVSPAAAGYMKEMAAKSYAVTRRRFGNVIQMYVPLYLSNFCSNQCVYCGFNCSNKIHRVVLNEDEIRREAEAIRRKYKFQHILLVTGESPAKASVEYMGRAIEIMKEYFSQVSLEVQPLEADEYRYLMDRGLHAVYVYQETYNEARYPVYHLKGKKRNFRYRLETPDRLGEAGMYKIGLGNLIGLEDWRTEAFFMSLHLRYLETPDRLGEAGMYKIGLGNLIGLEDWRTEAFFMSLHLRYLETQYWQSKYCFAFPRLRPYAGEGAFNPNYPAGEKELLQLICAYRLLSEDLELSISTRESSVYRDKIMPFGVTTMSAGSKTMPGGYADEDDTELEQFAINDDRTPAQVEAAVRAKGFDPVWKDWSLYLQESCIGNAR